MFRETYFDDPSGALSKAGASVRARVRFDDNEPYTVRRVLLQAKEGRAVDGDRSAVHKFEKRFEGGYAVDEAKAQELLRTGKDTDGTSPLKVAQMLYKLAKDRGTLPPDQNLRLEPKSIILQKRRRSHIQFESLSDVQGKRERLQQEIDAFKSRNEAVPPALQRYADKLDAQVKFLTEASELLRKYGQYMPSNTDGFILSADRYSVYDPSMRASPPNDIDDEVGRVGRGLHIEAEWDTASSDPFEKCGKEQGNREAPGSQPRQRRRAQGRPREAGRHPQGHSQGRGRSGAPDEGEDDRRGPRARRPQVVEGRARLRVHERRQARGELAVTGASAVR
jgi:hypothetical protein